LAARAAAGRVVDGHGDLRPEHVYLTTPPRTLDRLDFDAELRRVDWLEDLALLAVDLERLRRPWIAEALVRALARRLDDAPPARLWRFYRAWRGLLRAELCLEHRARPGKLGVHGWLARAKTYLAIARRHATRLEER
jgi:aminoglycoside phosphotransferase family enzyme